jgi:hypothetical protein
MGKAAFIPDDVTLRGEAYGKAIRQQHQKHANDCGSAEVAALKTLFDKVQNLEWTEQTVVDTGISNDV